MPSALTGRAVTIDGEDASLQAHLELSLVLGPSGAVVDYSGEVRCREHDRA
jgi:hypothetical protein